MNAFRTFCVVLLVFGSISEAKFDDFEDEEDIVEYDDNDFAEFEDVTEDAVTESPQRVITTEDDEDETTVELEGQDENQEGDFEDSDTQVTFFFKLISLEIGRMEKLVTSTFPDINIKTPV